MFNCNQETYDEFCVETEWCLIVLSTVLFNITLKYVHNNIARQVQNTDIGVRIQENARTILTAYSHDIGMCIVDTNVSGS